jgi:Fe-S-cluster-containing hydrogenase component 2
MQNIVLDKAKTSGILTEDVLVQTPGYSLEALEKTKGAVVMIECAQNIPCNPCETVCPHGAITVGKPITNLPTVYPEKCIGCGICVAICPGLAIFLVNLHAGDGLGSVTFAYEYLPVPAKGDMVKAVDREGNVVCDATVEKVVSVKNYDMTKVVTITVPAEYANVVRGIARRKREWRMESCCKCHKGSDDVVVCRCEEVTRAEIEKAIAAGCHDLDAIKRATRAGMGMCQSKGCTPVISRMIAKEVGMPMNEIKPFTKRSPLRPIKASALDYKH